MTKEPEEPRTRGDLEFAILGQEPRFTALEVATETGITVDQARRLWWALGFPEHGLEVAFTEADVEAVSRLIGIVDSGAIPFDIAVELTRAVGQTMARLADWEVSTLAHRIEEVSEDGTSRINTAISMVEAVNPPFEELIRYAWRRHLAASVGRLEALGANDEDLHAVQVTVGFADIVNFTGLSNEMSQERLGDVVDKFESRAADVVAGQRGRIIKSLGDAVLFVNEDPVRALRTAEGIIQVVGRDPRLPDVRLGLATGSVVTRLGDVFGPAVNLASRLTAVARRNRVIIDKATADLLPPEHFATQELPERPIRGFGVLQPVSVRRK